MDFRKMIFWRGVAIGTFLAYVLVLLVDGERAARRVELLIVGFILVIGLVNWFSRASEKDNSVQPERDH